MTKDEKQDEIILWGGLGLMLLLVFLVFRPKKAHALPMPGKGTSPVYKPTPADMQKASIVQAYWRKEYSDIKTSVKLGQEIVAGTQTGVPVTYVYGFTSDGLMYLSEPLERAFQTAAKKMDDKIPDIPVDINIGVYSTKGM